MLLGLARAQPTNLRFTHYTTREGLSNNHVQSIFQDSRGLLWIGTRSGLNIFDGISFEKIYPTDFSNFQLYSDDITKIKEDAFGNILFVTADGLGLYNWTEKNISLILPSKNNDAVLDVMMDLKKNVWVLTTTGLKLYDAHLQLLNNWKFEISEKSMDFLSGEFYIADDRNNIWFSANNMIQRMNATTRSINNRFSSTDHCRIFDIPPSGTLIQDKHGNFWITNDSLARYDRINNSFIGFHHPKGDHLLKLLASRAGKFFITSSYNGLYVFDPLRNELQIFRHDPANEKSPSDNLFTAICEDNSGNIWLGTNYGLDRGNDELNTFHAFDDFGYITGTNGHNKPTINDIGISGPKILVATNGGLFIVNTLDRSKQHFRFDEKNYSERDGYLSSVLLSKTNSLVSTWRGLWQFNTNENRLQPTPFAVSHPRDIDSVPVVSMFRDSRGNIWFGMFADRGVYRWNIEKSSFTKYDQYTKGDNHFPLRHFSCAAEDDSGNIWMGHDKGGLAVFNLATQRFVQPATLSFAEMNNNVIHSIINDHHGNLWMGTSAGLMRYFLQHGTLTRFTRKDGLVSNIIFGLAFDRGGNLWIGEYGGLSMLRPGATRFTRFVASDKLPEENIEKVYFDSLNNRICCTSDHTLFFFDPDELQKYSAALTPVITSFKILGKERNADGLNPVRLSYSENFFSFNYTASNFINPFDNRYAYKLEGFDNDWIDAGNRRYVNYTNLPGGTYTFRLKASTDETNWSEMKIPIHISISTVFYKTTWFIALLVFVIFIVAVIVIFFAYQVQLQRMISAQNIRNNIASDLHDDIGSSLSSIMLMSEVAQKQPAKSNNYLVQITETSRKIIENMNDIVWAVNPANDTIEQILVRMQHFASDLLDKRNADLQFEADSEIKNLRLGMQERKNMYLIFKEAIHNAFKYAQCARVTVQLRAEAGMVLMKIEDDGIGFDTSEQYSGNGLHNLKKRAAEMKANIEVRSLPGTGTTVSLYFKSTQRGR